MVTVLVLAALASGWWLRSVEAPPTPGSGAVRHEPDYYLTDFELTEMGPDGTPAHRLEAEDLYHYPDDASARLARPRLILYQDAGAYWDITADRGLVQERDRQILLHGEVHIRHAGVTPGEVLEIHTRDLSVWPDRRQAETAAAVRIEHRTGVTRAVGMRVDLARQRLDLLEHVQGEYEP